MWLSGNPLSSPVAKGGALALMCASLSSCAAYEARVAHVNQIEAREACKRAGYASPGVAMQQCINNTIPTVKAERRQLASDLIAGGVLVGAALTAARAGGDANLGAAPQTPISTFDTSARTRGSVMACGNGQYVFGTRCFAAPDGTYVSGPPRLAPDGSYVAGTPRIAPNGRYVGGAGQIIACPDGSYVAGSSCVMTPDGRYVGRP